MKAQEIQDAELLALAALAQVEAVIMAGDNAARAFRQEPPEWSSGCGLMPAGTRLWTELVLRGLIK